MTTYTILNSDGDVINTGLSLHEAAAEILTSDSREFDIRADDDGFTLWSRQQVANRGWHKTKFFSVKSDRDAAESEIFQDVVDSERFPGHCEAVSDETYAEMLAAMDDDE